MPKYLQIKKSSKVGINNVTFFQKSGISFTLQILILVLHVSYESLTYQRFRRPFSFCVKTYLELLTYHIFRHRLFFLVLFFLDISWFWKKIYFRFTHPPSNEGDADEDTEDCPVPAAPGADFLPASQLDPFIDFEPSQIFRSSQIRTSKENVLKEIPNDA